MKKDTMKSRSIEDLTTEVSSLKKQLFNLRLQMQAGQVKDYAQFKRIRADIARALTLINQQRRSSLSVS
jgi:large subunit ribosomal protein L29